MAHERHGERVLYCVPVAGGIWDCARAWSLTVLSSPNLNIASTCACAQRTNASARHDRRCQSCVRPCWLPSSPPPSTAPCESSVSTHAHARRPTIHSHVSISKHDSLSYRQSTEIVTEIARDANFPRFDAAQGWGPWLWYQCDSAVAAPNLAPGFRPFRAC